jgi:cholinesterase
MSGCVFNKTWSIIPRKNQAEQLARLLGWNGKSGNDSEVLEFLEDVPAYEFDNVLPNMLTDEEEFGFGTIIPFGPVIEPYNSDNCVIFKDPVEMSREAWSNDIDVIVMGTSFEGILRANWKLDQAFEVLKNPSYFAPLRELNLLPSDSKAIELGKKIKKVYYEEGQEPSIENQLSYLEFTSFQHFWHGLYRLVLSRNSRGSGKTFLFRFDVDGELNIFKKLVKKCAHISGACHADDLFYLFNTIYHPPPPKNSPEFLTIQMLVGMFTSFAITGDPNCDQVKSSLIKPFDGSDSFKCYNITLNDFAEVELPEAAKLNAWNAIYEETNVPLI